MKINIFGNNVALPEFAIQSTRQRFTWSTWPGESFGRRSILLPTTKIGRLFPRTAAMPGHSEHGKSSKSIIKMAKANLSSIVDIISTYCSDDTFILMAVL